ncbi:MAG: hypothetical protein GF398_01035 [Chitinivibrionales bacterium]|nr:hypothetical protein [Chitinivibrionales bacterium]
MRLISSLLLVALLWVTAVAQDGIYGSFIVGQKFIDLGPLNDVLKEHWDYSGKEFSNNRWTFGGEGHLVIAKRLILGGRAFGIFDHRKFDTGGGAIDPAAIDNLKDIKLTAGMGIANVGFNLLPVNKTGLRLYPAIGAGVQSFIFQAVSEINESQKNFEDVLVNNSDEMITLGKIGFVTDVSAGLDWYKPFKNFFTILPGLDLGIMLHAEIGYSFLPVKLKWRRDVDPGGAGQVEGGPDLQFSGMYFNAGLGLGLSPN